jgi:hypothetical protein
MANIWIRCHTINVTVCHGYVVMLGGRDRAMLPRWLRRHVSSTLVVWPDY